MHRFPLFTFVLFTCSILKAQNPFITDQYTADPSAHVFNDTLYIYCSHDEDTATWFNMQDWHVFSTTDLKQWKDHGAVFSLNAINWAKRYAWAPDCAQFGGKYYFYYPVERDYIGVAIGNSPTGPFQDPLNKPLLSRSTAGVVNNRDLIDPCIFIDEDSSAYLYFGQNTALMVQLNKDLSSFDDKVGIIKGLPDFFEAIWVHKRKGIYYLSYSGRGQLLYATSDTPYGPFEYKGIILDKVNSGTNHHSIVNYKGKDYLFYHTSDRYFDINPQLERKENWNGISPYRRSVCVDELYYNEDGSIRRVVPTRTGVKPVK